MLSYTSVLNVIISGECHKMKGMTTAAGETHKPHPKHSQETHEDPTRQDNPAHTDVNLTVLRQAAEKEDPQHRIEDCI